MPMTKIEHDFPDFDTPSLASQGNAILGIRDSGKSYTAIKIAELFFDAGIPFVGFDPIGRWRFLRVPGRGPGCPVVVAGGMGGDLPLTAASATEIVRAAMQSGISLIVDLYDMEISKADWRKIVADSVRVLLYENGAHGLRHIFIEEAAEFAPQRIGPEQGRVYAEIEKLARMGGNARLGYTLINQRAEEVNKAVLELCDNLFLHRQKGRNSLNALTKWLDLADVKPGSNEIIKSLPMLPQGECWAWMAGTNRPVLLKVPPKNSFEPDRRAMRGDAKPVNRASVDVADFVAQLKARLAGQPIPKPMERDVKESEARALRSENDRLKAEIADLKRRLATPQKPHGEVLDEMDHQAKYQPALDLDALYAEFKRRAMTDAVLLRVLAERPEIEVLIERKTVQMDASTSKGRIVVLLARGFFDGGTTNGAIRNELKRTGADMSPVTIAKFLDELVRDGFITRDDGRYVAVPDMKVNIKQAA
jgi:polyhydroxyalkanoate synthesis regulator phasin